MNNADVRYDRQLRLWGEEGQSSIGGASVCVFGAGALGTEVLKSLVLAGVKSFLVIDGAVVEPADVGNNFFLLETDIGCNRAAATLEKLKELNPSVAGDYWAKSPADMKNEDFGFLSRYSAVVGTNLSEEIEANVAAVLYTLSVPFITAKVYGMIGTIRICISEHTIANTHEENPRPDLRLDAPFPEILEMVAETILDEMTIEQLRHTPYILLYFHALKLFREKHSNAAIFPESYAQRKEIQEILLSMRRTNDAGSKDSENFDEAKAAVTRSFQRTKIPSTVQEVLTDESCRTSKRPFWIICDALRRFVDNNNGLLPLRGILPDMASDTQRYTRLTRIFHERAQAEAYKVMEFVCVVENERGVCNVIDQDMCYKFCKNADQIRVQRGAPMNPDYEIKSLVRMIRDKNVDEAEGQVDCDVWLLLLRAAYKFFREKGRFPGTNGVPCTIDASDLRHRVESLVKMANVDVEKTMARIPKEAIAEVCRFGASELHVVASFIGGVTAQEVIKLATNQYVPIDNTFVFDGHTQMSATLKL